MVNFANVPFGTVRESLHFFKPMNSIVVQLATIKAVGSENNDVNVQKAKPQGQQNVLLVFVITVNFTEISAVEFLHDLKSAMVNMWLIIPCGGQRVCLQVKNNKQV